MSQACPLAFRLIDGTIARLNALSVTLLVLVGLFTQESLFLLFLSVDFMIRIYGKKEFSPVYQVSILIQEYFKIPQSMVDAGAKRLAAIFGLVFSVLLFIALWFSLQIFAYVLGLIFLTCTFLEITFSFCVGCQVYFIIKKIFPSFMN